MSRHRGLPSASQALLQELHQIISNGEKDDAQREEDCSRVQEILSLGAPGVYPDNCFDYGQSLLCFALHYDFGHPAQMLTAVMDSTANSDRITLKSLVNAPTNEMDREHILEVVATLTAIDADPHMREKALLLKRAGADLNWGESTTDTDRSGLSLSPTGRARTSRFTDREYGAIG